MKLAQFKEKYYKLSEALEEIKKRSLASDEYIKPYIYLPVANFSGDLIILQGRYNNGYDLLARIVEYDDGEPVSFKVSGHLKTICTVGYNCGHLDQHSGFKIGVFKDWFKYIQNGSFKYDPPTSRTFQVPVTVYETHVEWTR